MIKFAQIFAKKSEIAQANFTQNEPKNLQNLNLNELKKLQICLILQFCVVVVFALAIIVIYISMSLLSSIIILLNLAYGAFGIVFLSKIYEFFVISKFRAVNLWQKYTLGAIICIITLYLMNDFLYTASFRDLYSKNTLSGVFAVIAFLGGFGLIFRAYKKTKFGRYFKFAFVCLMLIVVPDFLIFISYIFADFSIYKIIFEIIISGLSATSAFFVFKLGFFVYAPILLLINIVLEFWTFNQIFKTQISKNGELNSPKFD